MTQLLATKRCGVRDIINNGLREHRKTHRQYRHPGRRSRISANPVARYVLHHYHWPSKEISFRINNKASTMMPIDTEREIVQAFKAWEEVTELKFQEEYDSSAIIQISFETGDHNDGQKFYGKTVAHAFFPNPNRTLAGDIHFNDDIEFTSRRHLVDDSDETSLLAVAVHEIGHSIGLDHTMNQNSVMWPWYRKNQAFNNPFPGLDDITAVQSLYGTTDHDGHMNETKMLISVKNFFAQYDVFKNISLRFMNIRAMSSVEDEEISSIAFDCREKNVLWSEYLSGIIYTARLNGTDREQQELIKSSGRPTNLVIDWSSRNLFYFDKNKKAISVLSLNGKYQKTIINIQNETKYSLAMTIDLQNRILKLSRISCIGLNGRNEHVVFNGTTADGNMRYYSSDLIVIGERFYWTGRQKVHSVTIDGLDYKSFHVGDLDILGAIAAMPENCEGVESECALNNGGCPYLCLPKSKGGVSCVCPDNIENLCGC